MKLINETIFYLDTSIFGGYFEPEFQLWSKQLIEEILVGNYFAIISDLTLFELASAPHRVKDLAEEIITTNSEFVKGKYCMHRTR